MRADDLRLVCEAADEWASEYGFVSPDRATLVLAAIHRLVPDVLSARNREYFDALAADLQPATAPQTCPDGAQTDMTRKEQR